MTSRRSPRTWLLAALALAVVGVVALVVATTGQQSPPQPAAGAGDDGATSSSSSGTAQPAPPAPAEPSAPAGEAGGTAGAAPVAAPVSVSVAAIGVTSELMDLGLNDDGTVEVPPLERDDRAGWYSPGPAPGAVGPAVLLGHVDSAEYGPGVFYDLGALEPGDEVEVTREDGTVAVFAVDRVERHPKDEFPTIEVYGNTDGPELRLITCGGAFDSGAGSYEDNVIAFASLVGTRPA
ncbi:class F sortase [Geodermatophilus nigrescens]|uniref:Sortase family protein n=1 Tax=Geodermatophilus nigrescens TaxID=1070870 RepID=A0A1M5J1L3_9ACTN|nr:class F sortase [Geodermatophilus nigrescens]SHG34120.1 Sortase family protein [Geodermatophilus nigrescens]